MIIIWGSRLFGKVDEVKGLFFVATKFGHLWYIPLIPLGSHLVIEETSDGWRGIPIGFSFKSMLIAWLRAALFVGTIGCIIGAVMGFSEGRSSEFSTAVLFSIAAAAGIGLFAATKLLRGMGRASHQRAKELVDRAGGNPLLHLHVDQIFAGASASAAPPQVRSQPPVSTASAKPVTTSAQGAVKTAPPASAQSWRESAPG